MISTFAFIIAIISWKYVPDKLDIYLNDPNYEDAIVANSIPQTTNRYFHIVVKNNHTKQMAMNCRPYLVSLKNKSNGRELVSVPIPLKWRGYSTSVTDIEPNREQRFNAFHVNIWNPIPISFDAYIDSTDLLPIANFPGKYDASFRVTSSNFKEKNKSFEVNLSVNATEVYIKEI